MIIQNTLQEEINKLKSANFKELERTEELGRDYSFKQAVDFVQKISNDLNQVVENAAFLRIPEITEKRILTLAQNVNKYVEKIKSFILLGNEANAASQRQEINDGLARLYQEDLEVLPPLIERANILKLNPTEVEGKVTQALESIKEINNIKDEAKKTKENIDVAIKEVRDALGKEGALISANDFEKQAIEHKDLAKKWFWGTVASIIVTTILVIILFTIPSLKLTSVGQDYPRILQILVFKIILLSIAYLLVYESIKNYRINEHLYILNKHRQLTLSVYPLMAKATSDPVQSNTIVAQAAKAIFEPGTTGYLDNKDGKNSNPINLTEIINKVVDKS